MFDILIREVAARFGVGDKALPLLQMLLAYMTNKETGGLTGFLEKFKAAGFGPIVQSWLGGGPAGQPISNSQIETVLGSSGGLLSQLTSRLSLERDSVASSLGYLIPVLVGKLTPGGSIPSSLPAEVATMASAGQALLAAPTVTTVADSSTRAGWMKWVPWVIVAIAALLGLNYCSRSQVNEVPPAVAPVTPAEPAASGSTGEFGPGPATTAPPAAEPSAPGSAVETPAEPAAPASAAEGSASQADTGTGGAAGSTGSDASGAPASVAPAATGAAATAGADEPAGAGVVGWGAAGEAPALKVYFDSGSAVVSDEFAAKAEAVVNYLKENADARAVISGFNDATGDPAKNAELSKQRAEAVQAALVAAGVPQDRTVLDKPVDSTDTSARNSASRRVEVMIRE